MANNIQNTDWGTGADYGGDPWSAGLSRPPEWLRNQDQQTVDFFKNIYDTQADPNGYTQGLLAQMRAANPDFIPHDSSGNPGQSDAELLPYLDEFVSGGMPKGTGAANTQNQMNQLMQAIQGVNVGPDVTADQIPGPGEFPTFTVGGENLGPAIDDTLTKGMAGEDPLGVGAVLKDYLEQSKGGAINSAGLLNRLNAARENLTKGETGALADMRGVLADRGLISLPGSPEGAETDATMRTLAPLQQAYLSQVRQAQSDEETAADSRLSDALSKATGWTSQQAAAKLASANSASERQQMLSTIALQNLEQNRLFTQFTAQFGLDREQLLNSIRQGKIDAIAPVLQMFSLLVNSSRGGYV